MLLHRSQLAGSMLGVVAALAVAGCNDDSATTVTTPVAKKPSTVAMPAVEGRSLGTATRQLHARGLRLEVTGRYASESAGRVLRTDPSAGARVAPHTRVAVVVSRGPKPEPAGGAPSPTSTTPTSPPASGCPHGQYTASDGSCQPIPQSYGGSPPANSPEGKRDLQQNPDCRGMPPPPPDYKGPVQC